MEKNDTVLYGARKTARRRNKLPPICPKAPSDKQVETLLATARARTTSDNIHSRFVRLRDIAILEAFRSTGLRNAELTRLRRRQLKRGQKVAEIIGKGNKPRDVIFDKAALKAVWAYLDARAE